MRLIDGELLNLVEEGDPQKVADLLRQGADPDCRYTNGYTVLMGAVSAWKQSPEKRYRIAKTLLEYGANPFYISSDGHQALTHAFDIDVVECLLDAGLVIDTNIATKIMYNFHGNMQIKSLLKKRGIKTKWFDSVIQIYYRIQEYDRCSLYDEVLKEAIPVIQNSLCQMERYKKYDPDLPFCSDIRWDFYALSRINELLLLDFQNKTDGNDPIQVTLDEYIDFWVKAGLNVYEPKEFHPFYCEIYKVKECMELPNPKLMDSRWPCLMFGDLLFSRASVSVSASTDCIHKKTAEESTLYWSHQRWDRKYEDLSLGWGSNSQWRTSFRFDYWSNEDLLYNVDHGDKCENDELSTEQQLELLKYRCFVKTVEMPDCFPYNYYSTEKYKRRN
ncbi:MAG: ankyrin repeat domain-containing protein [Peptococcaceae bacterium]|nr:ankyrin repeat domain-containing protein [Peptococcaceae bacterium]